MKLMDLYFYSRQSVSNTVTKFAIIIVIVLGKESNRCKPATTRRDTCNFLRIAMGIDCVKVYCQ